MCCVQAPYSTLFSVFCKTILKNFRILQSFRILRYGLVMADGAVQRLDCGGALLTCTSDEALESFNKGLLEYVSVRQSALSHWERAVELDPAFVLAHCALVRDGYAHIYGEAAKLSAALRICAACCCTTPPP